MATSFRTSAAKCCLGWSAQACVSRRLLPDPDVAVADHLAPLVAFGLEIGGELVRRIADRNEADGCELLLHVGHGDDLDHLLADDFADLFRRAGLNENADR